MRDNTYIRNPQRSRDVYNSIIITIYNFSVTGKSESTFSITVFIYLYFNRMSYYFKRSRGTLESTLSYNKCLLLVTVLAL